MTYRVVAPLVIAKDQERRPHHVYEGGIIQWLSDEQAEHFLSTGLVEKVGGSVSDESDELEESVIDTGGKPDAEAQKAELIEWVLANVVKDDETEYSEAELKRLNKDELWALINSVPDESDDSEE